MLTDLRGMGFEYNTIVVHQVELVITGKLLVNLLYVPYLTIEH